MAQLQRSETGDADGGSSERAGRGTRGYGRPASGVLRPPQDDVPRDVTDRADPRRLRYTSMSVALTNCRTGWFVPAFDVST